MDDEALDDQIRALWHQSLEHGRSPRARPRRSPKLAAAAAAVVIVGLVGLILRLTNDTDDSSVVTDQPDERSDGPVTTGARDFVPMPKRFTTTTPVLDGSIPMTLIDGTDILVEVSGRYATASVTPTLWLEAPAQGAAAVFAASPDELALARCFAADGSDECLLQRTSSDRRVDAAVGVAGSANRGLFITFGAETGQPFSWPVDGDSSQPVADLYEDIEVTVVGEGWLVFDDVPPWVDPAGVRYDVTLSDTEGATMASFRLSPQCTGLSTYIQRLLEGADGTAGFDCVANHRISGSDRTIVEHVSVSPDEDDEPNDCPQAPDGNSAVDFDDSRGTYATNIKSVEGDDITFDVVQWLVGDAADEAHREEFPDDPGGAPNDYFIRNANDEVRAAPIDAEATVRLVRLQTDADPSVDPGSVSELPTYVAAGHSSDIYWLTFEDGAIVEICEQYRP